jgi:hypothetical protein
MSRLDPEGRLKPAERRREQALSLGNSNERVRFSLTWESIAAMSERLQASISPGAPRPSEFGAVVATR